ncbi:MAG: SelB C-terminal domain-containing protein [Candidatus Staskawiczbacteria bacterium]|nr:SelB C-terminal domain-containing protein [Candidatus Staskawiczbacteria bacterium]
MNPYAIILIILAVAIIILLLTRKGREATAGICATALDQTVRKSANKEKALAFIRERGKASNEELREHLGVSRRSVVRYLDALEREGIVAQAGDAGRSVIYRLK